MEITTAVVAGVVFVLALLFRTEIKKVVAWLVSFRRITKTADGYALEPGGEPQAALVEDTTGGAKVKAAQKSTSKSDLPDDESPDRWIELLADGRHDEASAWLEAKIAQTADEVERIRFQSFKGHVLFEKDPATGKRYFADLIRTHPDNEDAYHWHGLSYFFASLFNEAVDAFDAGLRRLPDSHRLIESKAEALTRSGRNAQAIETLRDAIARGVTHPLLYTRLAAVLEENGEPETFEEVLKAGIRENPRDHGIRDRYATFLWEQGRNEEAVAQFRELVSLDRKASRYWAMLGNAYLNLGLHGSALESYERADELAEGREAWILGNIGNLYSGRGLYAKATEYLRRAVDLDPTSEYAQDRLAKAITARGEEGKKAEEAEQAGWKRLSASSGAGGSPEGL